jgi:hypothetical protein
MAKWEDAVSSSSVENLSIKIGVSMKKSLFLLLALLPSFCVTANDFNWSHPPVTISTSNLNASDARVVADPSGNLVAVWIENSVLKASTKPLNMNWTSAVTLSSATPSMPKLAVDPSGNAVAVWLDGTTVKAATKLLSGSWSSSAALSSTSATSPTVALSASGDAVAAWARNNNIETSTKLFGANWQNRVTITSSGSASPMISLSGSGSSAVATLVWQGTAGTLNVIFASNKTISGSWNAAQTLSSPLHNAKYPQVAMDSAGNASAVWYQYDVLGTIYSGVSLQSASKIAGGSWTDPAPLSAEGIGNPALLAARIAYDNCGNALALWNNSYDGENFSVESAIKPVRSEWSPSTRVVEPNQYAFGLDIAVSSFGNGLAVYMFYNGSSLFIQAAEVNLSGFMNNVWSVPLNLAQDSNNAYPRVAAAVFGNTIQATAIWAHSNGTNNQIKAITGVKTLVLPPSTLTVTQAQNNLGVFSEYQNTLSWHASTDPDVQSYLIYRNGVLIQEVAASQLQVIDHNMAQSAAVTYGVAAVNSEQSQSRIITVNFP